MTESDCACPPLREGGGGGLALFCVFLRTAGVGGGVDVFGAGVLFTGEAFGFCASRTKSLMKSILSCISEASTPCSVNWFRKFIHDGSTLSDIKPLSGSYPMCARCLKDPACGADMSDFSILPLFAFFAFFFAAVALALPVHRVSVIHRALSRETHQYYYAFSRLSS